MTATDALERFAEAWEEAYRQALADNYDDGDE
jgi:hypothetical protein